VRFAYFLHTQRELKALLQLGVVESAYKNIVNRDEMRKANWRQSKAARYVSNSSEKTVHFGPHLTLKLIAV
jgi:hypothetical protein